MRAYTRASDIRAHLQTMSRFVRLIGMSQSVSLPAETRPLWACHDASISEDVAKNLYDRLDFCSSGSLQFEAGSSVTRC